MAETKQKPLELSIIEFRNHLNDLVNTYIKDVPAMFIADSLRNLLGSVDAMANEQVSKLANDFYKPEVVEEKQANEN